MTSKSVWKLNGIQTEALRKIYHFLFFFETELRPTLVRDIDIAFDLYAVLSFIASIKSNEVKKLYGMMDYDAELIDSVNRMMKFDSSCLMRMKYF